MVVEIDGKIETREVDYIELNCRSSIYARNGQFNESVKYPRLLDNEDCYHTIDGRCIIVKVLK